MKNRLRTRRIIEAVKGIVGPMRAQSEKFNWSLAISYNSMLLARRVLMFSRGYRPSSTESHVAVVRFLRASLETEVSDRTAMVLNGMKSRPR
jgi:hypothetical protein